jgi:hypothetical protein
MPIPEELARQSLDQALAGAPQPAVLATGTAAAPRAEFGPATLPARVRAMPGRVTQWGEHKPRPAR